MDREDVIAAILSAAGGRMTGRVRLQKCVYLLDQIGLHSGFDYEYYHYGPYSSEVTGATEDAKAFGLVEERIAHRSSDGAPFSIFCLKDTENSHQAALGSLSFSKAQECLSLMGKKNATVLEIAATIHWLSEYELCDDWKDELVRRKGVKAQGGRLDEALGLLKELDLPPATKKVTSA